MNSNFRYRSSLNEVNPGVSNRDVATGVVKNYDGGAQPRTMNTMQKVDPTIAAAMMPGYTPTPSVKASGAPTPFSPSSIQTMNNAFGMPIDGSYDRAMGMVDPTQSQGM